MTFQKHGDVEKHEVVTPQQNEDLNKIRKSGKVKLDDIEEESESSDE